MENTYTPNPVHTDDVIVPAEINDLIDLLAKNTHEIWARLRMEEGWTYGPCRDDNQKKHPDLKPYEELEDSEKTYDRQTAIETIKVILSLGYRITK